MKKVVLSVFLLMFFTVTNAVTTTLGGYSSESKEKKVKEKIVKEKIHDLSSTVVEGDEINLEWTPFEEMTKEQKIQISTDGSTWSDADTEAELLPTTSSAKVINFGEGVKFYLRVAIIKNKKIECSNTVEVEVPQQLDFDTNIVFYNPVGTCIADATGLTYIFDGNMYREPTLVYPEEYWGNYPLYFPGVTVPTAISVTYNGPTAQEDITVENIAYSLNTDGSNGGLVYGPTTQDITIAKDETLFIHASFPIPVQAKGLYRFTTTIYSGEELLMSKEAILCPPDMQ